MASGNAQSTGEKYFEYAKKCFDFYFGKDAELIDGYIEIAWMDEMRLKYHYLPKNLMLEIEHSRGFLSATIVREDGGFRFLSTLHGEKLPRKEGEPFTAFGFNPADIEAMIAFLARVLQEDFVFHIRKGKKLYADEGGTLRLLPES